MYILYMKKFSFGNKTFKELQEQNYFYIKRTELIYEIVNEGLNPYYAWDDSISIGLKYLI